MWCVLKNSVYAKLLKLLIVLLFIQLSIIQLSCQSKNEPERKANSQLKGTISISGAFALYPLTVKWAEEFKKIYPEIRIDISAGGAGKGMTDALSGAVDLGMFSRAIMDAEKAQGVWWVAVTKDAVLSTISAHNPVLVELKKKGLTRQQFIEIFIEGTLTEWGKAVGTTNSSKINVFTRSDACGAAGTWAEYLGGVQENLKGVGIFGDPGLADVVKSDPLGIGFNNTIYIYNRELNKKYDGLEVIPIDKNENGRIDPEENFYDTMDQIIEAIASGKYPSPPARELYFVARETPTSLPVIKFLEWILNDGQKFVLEAGYVSLTKDRVATELAKLKIQ